MTRKPVKPSRPANGASDYDSAWGPAGRRFMVERNLGKQLCSGSASRTLPWFRGKNFDV